MDSIRLNICLDESINHIDQLACTLELVLSGAFKYDSIDLNGSEAEIRAGIEICRQYPVWRAALCHVWESLTAERDALAGALIPREAAQ